METATLVSIEKFLEEAAQTADRIEYADGEIIHNMAGASRTHEQIVSRILAAFFRIFNANRYEIYPSNRFLYIAACNKFVLPDVMVVEGEEEIYTEERDSFQPLMNPLVIVEVMSGSTKDYDRGEKLDCYQQIASVRQIVLISSEKIQVKSYRYQSPGEWHYTQLDNIAQSLDFMGNSIAVEELYRKVTF
jgi:Uma2 family endonuclease